MIKKKKLNPREMLNEKRNYCDEVHNELKNSGVTFFEPEEKGGTLNINEEYLELPREITEISSKDLGEYLNAFTQHKIYMRTLLGYAEMYLEEARESYSSMSSEMYRKLLNSKLSETSKDREVNTSKEVKPYFDNYNNCRNKVKLLNYTISNIEDIIFLLSREVSRRSGDFNEENRSYNATRR